MPKNEYKKRENELTVCFRSDRKVLNFRGSSKVHGGQIPKEGVDLFRREIAELAQKETI